MPTAAEQLARFAASIRYEDLPGPVAAKAKLLMLDALGIALAASRTPLATAIHAVGSSLGAGGACTAVGSRVRLPAPNAALVNGALIHALDFDDTHSPSLMHVSAPVVPAALAGAEEGGRSGREALAAMVAGVEAMVRVGLAAPDAFHARGFHPTAIGGTLGAALAYGKTRGLGAERLAWALGIAGSQAAGLMEFLSDGSPVKVFHPGWAAHGGMVAALLAERGVRGPATVLEGRFGLLRSHLGEGNFNASALVAGLGERWETLEVSFKPYPCGHVIHPFLDAALTLRREGGFGPEGEGVEEVTCFAPPGAVRLVGEPAERKRAPQSDYEGKFSLPYSIACILARGRCGVDEYSEEAIRDPAILSLAARVRVVPGEFPEYPRSFPGRVRIRLKDGRTLEREEKHNRGSPAHPLTGEEVETKFLDNARRSVDGERVRQIGEAVLRLEGEPGVGPLMALLAF
ncbi:MAG: MmgE/PrpD family protein [Nitrospinota bacterium]